MSPEALSIEEEIIRKSSAGQQKLPMLDVFFARIPLDLSSTVRSRIGLHIEAQTNEVRYDSWGALLETMADRSLSLEAEAMPWRGKCYVWIEPTLLYAALEMQMGGIGESVHIPDRGPTQIERRLARSIFDLVLGVAAENIGRVTPVSFQSSSVESLQQASTAMPGNSLCAAGIMQMKIGLNTGQMMMVFPLSTLDPVQSTLSTRFLGERMGDPTWRDHIRETISESHVELTAVMHSFRVAMNDVLNWKVGDVVPLHLAEVPEIRVLCSGHEILYGAGGQCGDNHYAVSIEREATPGEVSQSKAQSPFRTGVSLSSAGDAL